MIGVLINIFENEQITHYWSLVEEIVGPHSQKRQPSTVHCRLDDGTPYSLNMSLSKLHLLSLLSVFGIALLSIQLHNPLFEGEKIDGGIAPADDKAGSTEIVGQ